MINTSGGNNEAGTEGRFLLGNNQTQTVEDSAQLAGMNYRASDASSTTTTLDVTTNLRAWNVYAGRATPFISGLEGGPGVYGFRNNEQVSEFLLDTAPVRAVALLDVRDGEFSGSGFNDVRL